MRPSCNHKERSFLLSKGRGSDPLPRPRSVYPGISSLGLVPLEGLTPLSPGEGGSQAPIEVAARLGCVIKLGSETGGQLASDEAPVSQPHAPESLWIRMVGWDLTRLPPEEEPFGLLQPQSTFHSCQPRPTQSCLWMRVEEGSGLGSERDLRAHKASALGSNGASPCVQKPRDPVQSVSLISFFGEGCSCGTHHPPRVFSRKWDTRASKGWAQKYIPFQDPRGLNLGILLSLKMVR